MNISKIEEIFSVGIDIGTTTSSVVVSKLKIKNVAAGFQVPKIEIIEKTIIYRSGVFFTPLIDDVTIDFDGIADIVRQEYKKAKVNLEEIKTGAVIITGDTARKENAELVLKAISRMAGSFVVATAGPHLEAYIAGLGSGAAAYSAQKHTRVANVDVGGGTTNIAIFDDGKLISTLCADIGGRLIRFEPRSYQVDGYIRGGEVIAHYLNLPLIKGANLPVSEIKKISAALGEALVSILKGCPNSLAKDLAIGQLEEGITVEYVMFSGGIGRLLYNEEDTDKIETLTRFGDIGPALALGLKDVLKDEPLMVLEPDETIYATVIGAGVHTTELSGSTIFISDSEALPLRDLPAICLTVTEDFHTVSIEISEKIEKFSFQGTGDLPAIVVPKGFGNSFYQLKGLVQAVVAGIRDVKEKEPLVIICEDDIGKALGNFLINSLGNSRPVISIDQLTMKEGDYIDIGRPLYDGGVVPVVIKTLVFSNS